MRPTLWFRFRPHPLEKRWSVFLATREECAALRADAEGGPYVGRTVYGRRCIYISARQSEAEIRDTLTHELVHAAIGGHLTPHELEETVVEMIAPRLTDILSDIPMQFPPLPACAIALMKK